MLDHRIVAATKAKEEKAPTLAQLKAAIPSYCFKSSLSTSLLYVARDFAYAAALVYLALKIDSIPNLALRIVAWTAYMFMQGCVGTGIWILGHECGHGAFSPYETVNNCIGWFLHSILMVPYFSWKITHARHHRYTGHVTKDAVFSPRMEEQAKNSNSERVKQFFDMAEDTPLVTMVKLLGHQLIGWQAYLLFNVTAGKESLPEGRTKDGKKDMSHFGATSQLFLPSQQKLVVISDCGLLLTAGALYLVAQQLGWQKALLLYVGPYFWVHHWLVAITYLHHTHPDVPYYQEGSWSYTKGALGTVDRSLGFIGRHFFHEIIDYHLVHHLFTKIPFYHAEEATKAIMPLLGEEYINAKDESFLVSLYNTFKSCNYVTEDQIDQGSGKYFWVTKRS